MPYPDGKSTFRPEGANTVSGVALGCRPGCCPGPGSYRNLAANHTGTFHLRREEGTVYATFQTDCSPVQFLARDQLEALLTVLTGFRSVCTDGMARPPSTAGGFGCAWTPRAKGAMWTGWGISGTARPWPVPWSSSVAYAGRDGIPYDDRSGTSAGNSGTGLTILNLMQSGLQFDRQGRQFHRFQDQAS